MGKRKEKRDEERRKREIWREKEDRVDLREGEKDRVGGTEVERHRKRGRDKEL